MSQTTQARPPAASPNASGQDAWISAFTGQKVNRAAAAAAAAGGGDVRAPLAEVDEAMADLKQACAAVAAPEAKKVLDTVIGQLTRRRDVLAAAKDPADVAKQLDAVPALLQDIAKSTTAARRAKGSAAPVEAGIGSFLHDVGSAIGDAAGTVAHGVADAATTVGHGVADVATTVAHGVADVATTVAHGVADVATTVAHGVADVATTVGHAVEGAVETVGEVGSALAHLTQAPAVDCLKELDKWLPLFAQINHDNPVKRVSVALWARHKAAQSLSGLAKTTEENKIADAAVTADADAKKAYEASIIIEQQFKAAEKTLGALPDEQKNAVIAQRDTMRGDYDHAFTSSADVGALLGALKTLKTETASLQAQAVSIGDATKQVADDLAQAKAAIDKIKDKDKKDDFTKQYAALEKRLADAPKAGDTGAQKKALFALGKDAVALLQPAMQAQFAEQAATPEGKKQIDDMIKGMGDATDDPAKQATCKAAIAACYKVPLDTPDGVQLTRLPALYNMMAMIPAKDLKGLDKIEYETDPKMGTSYYSDKKVVFNEIGKEGDTQAMESQDATKPGKDPDYFKRTALHELGHYVDDKNNVMSGGMGKGEYGNWKDSNIDEIAGVFYNRSMKAFVGGGKKPTRDDLVALLKQALKDGSAKKPANASAPLGSLLDDWDSIVANAGYLDCLRVRNADASPWNHMVDAGDGRAYHEGYAGAWYSYPVSERGKGISNYQFRAPGEWFAEQFAYFRLFSDKTPPAAIAKYMTAS